MISTVVCISPTYGDTILDYGHYMIFMGRRRGRGKHWRPLPARGLCNMPVAQSANMKNITTYYRVGMNEI